MLKKISLLLGSLCVIGLAGCSFDTSDQNKETSNNTSSANSQMTASSASELQNNSQSSSSNSSSINSSSINSEVNHDSLDARYKRVDQQLLAMQHNSDGNIVFATFNHDTNTVTYKLSDKVSDDYKNKAGHYLVQDTKHMLNEDGFKDVVVKVLNNDGSDFNAHETNHNNDTVPQQFVGNWYTKDKKLLTIDTHSVDLNGHVITKDSHDPLQLDVQKQNNAYQLYKNPDPNASGAEGGDGTTYWVANMTIDGKKEPVLASYTRMGYFQVYTNKPTDKDYSFTYDGEDYESKLGTSDLDELAKADKNSASNNSSSNDENSDSSDNSKGDVPASADSAASSQDSKASDNSSD